MSSGGRWPSRPTAGTDGGRGRARAAAAAADAVSCAHADAPSDSDAHSRSDPNSASTDRPDVRFSGRRSPDPVSADPDAPDPYRDAGLTPEEAARLRAAAGRDTWVTRDGRELSIKQMYRPHIGNAQAVLTTWIKREKDPEKKRELKSWRSRMRRELAKREKAWQAKRKKEKAG